MSEATYEFWIDLQGDKRVTWERLTKKQAQDMYTYTNKTNPEGVEGYGWGEMSWGGDWQYESLTMLGAKETTK